MRTGKAILPPPPLCTCAGSPGRSRDDAGQGGILGQGELDRNGGGPARVGGGIRLAGDHHRHDARQRGQRARTAGQRVHLEPEERLFPDATLQLGRGADSQDPAPVDDGDPVAELVGLGHVAGREEDGPPGDGRPPGAQVAADLAGGAHIKAERRLVEEQDPRVVEEAPGEVELLALPGRERRDPPVALLTDPHQVDELVHPAPALGCPQAVELAEHPELLADGEGAAAGLLAAGDHLHDPADAARLGDDVEAGDAGRSLGRQEEGGQDLDERRRPRRPGQGGRRARPPPRRGPPRRGQRRTGA